MKIEPNAANIVVPAHEHVFQTHTLTLRVKTVKGRSVASRSQQGRGMKPPCCSSRVSAMDPDEMSTSNIHWSRRLAPIAVALGLLASCASGGLVSNATSHATFTTISNAVTAAVDGDLLIVSPGVYTEPGLQVPKNLTIYGDNATNTIVQAAAAHGVASQRVFTFAGGVTNVLENLTIRYGRTDQAGGGIYNNSGSVQLCNVTVSGNAAGRGGNGAPFGDGGSGGGVFNAYGSVEVSHSAVCDNNAGTSGDGAGATDGTGGGLASLNAGLQAHHTIVASNQAATALDCSGTLQSAGYNLIENTNDCTVTGTASGNIYGQDPLFAPLSKNGGPTRTHALLPGSPCIDAGNSEFTPQPDMDQRGWPRVDGGRIDIGPCETYDADDDDDGMSDTDEAAADTDPLSADSVLAITNISFELPTSVAVYWRGGIWATQYLECASSVAANAQQWKVVFTNHPPTAVATNVHVTLSPANSNLFFRIKVGR